MVVGAEPVLLLDRQYHSLVPTLGREAQLRRAAVHRWKKRRGSDELQTIDLTIASIPSYLLLLYRHDQMASRGPRGWTR